MLYGLLHHKGEDRWQRGRVAGLKGYCTGLILPPEPKNAEVDGGGIDPRHASAQRQALHQFVAKAPARWPDGPVSVLLQNRRRLSL